MNRILTLAVAMVMPLKLSQVIAADVTLEEMLANQDIRVAEDGVLGPDSQVCIDFVRAVVSQREMILSQLAVLAPDAPRQCKLIAASEFMTPHDYIAFLNGVCDASNSFVVTEQALARMLVPRMAKHGFLAVNYDQPQVRSVIDKLEVLANKVSKTRLKRFFTELKSGQMKEHVLARCAREGLPTPESFSSNTSEANRLAMGGAGDQIRRSPAIDANARAAPDTEAPLPPWSIFVVLIVVALGLLWLRLRKASGVDS